MRSLRDWNWKQWIIVAVQDQSWDRNFRQPIEIVGPQSLPGDLLPLPFEDGTAGAVLASKAHQTAVAKVEGKKACSVCGTLLPDDDSAPCPVCAL